MATTRRNGERAKAGERSRSQPWRDLAREGMRRTRGKPWAFRPVGEDDHRGPALVELDPIRQTVFERDGRKLVAPAQAVGILRCQIGRRPVRGVVAITLRPTLDVDRRAAPALETFWRTGPVDRVGDPSDRPRSGTDEVTVRWHKARAGTCSYAEARQTKFRGRTP